MNNKNNEFYLTLGCNLSIIKSKTLLFKLPTDI